MTSHTDHFSPFAEDEYDIERHVPATSIEETMESYPGLAEDEEDWEQDFRSNSSYESPHEPELQNLQWEALERTPDSEVAEDEEAFWTDALIDESKDGWFDQQMHEGIDEEDSHDWSYEDEGIDNLAAGMEDLFGSETGPHEDAFQEEGLTDNPDNFEEVTAEEEDFAVANDIDAGVIPKQVLYEGEKSQDAATIRTLIEQGFSENEITNIAFLARNPRSITKAKLSSKEQRIWRTIRNKEVRPLVIRMLAPQVVSPIDLAIFLSQYEWSDAISERHKRMFMTGSPLLSMGKSLRDKLLFRWRSGKPPAKISVIYREAYRLCQDAPTAMLLAHNVMKAFGKGGKAITWSRKEDNENHYTDGKKSFIPKKKHRSGRIISKDGRKSIFYLLFSSKQFGTSDPGDWYHFFVASTMTAYSGAQRLQSLLPKEEANVERFVRGAEDRAKGAMKGIKRAAYALLLGDQLFNTANQMSNPSFRRLSGYRGWTMANVLSFLEGGYYGVDQQEVNRESRAHRRGAIYGLSKASVRPRSNWLWYIPAAASLSKEDLVGGFMLRQKTIRIQNAKGKTLS